LLILWYFHHRRSDIIFCCHFPLFFPEPMGVRPVRFSRETAKVKYKKNANNWAFQTLFRDRISSKFADSLAPAFFFRAQNFGSHNTSLIVLSLIDILAWALSCLFERRRLIRSSMKGFIFVLLHVVQAKFPWSNKDDGRDIRAPSRFVSYRPSLKMKLKILFLSLKFFKYIYIFLKAKIIWSI
jgi:hypothetical protein